MKERKSITIDLDTYKKIEKQADFESRSFSGMIEYMAKVYLNNIKKQDKNDNNNR